MNFLTIDCGARMHNRPDFSAPDSGFVFSVQFIYRFVSWIPKYYFFSSMFLHYLTLMFTPNVVGVTSVWWVGQECGWCDRRVVGMSGVWWV